jgi:hypothetical protein
MLMDDRDLFCFDKADIWMMRITSLAFNHDSNVQAFKLFKFYAAQWQDSGADTMKRYSSFSPVCPSDQVFRMMMF